MRKRSDVTETLRQRVISARHFNALPAGGRLPSARALAAELQADPRVVLAAYRALEREGLVERRPPSRGFFAIAGAATPGGRAVSGPSPASGRAGGSGAPDTRPARRHADEWLVDVLVQALERDVPVPAFSEHARRAVETLRLRAACVECNTDEQAWLCRELVEDYGIEATAVEVEVAERSLAVSWEGDSSAAAPAADGASGHPPPTPARELPPALRRADLLVTTAAHAPLVQALAEQAGKAWVIVTHRADLAAEIERLLARGPVYFLGTDPRFAAKLRDLFSTWANSENVRPVILGIADASEIPAGAPAYVMHTARDYLGGAPPQVRVLPTLRAFSRETRAQLLRYLVRANVSAASASSGIRVT